MVDKQNSDKERRSEDVILHDERVYLRCPTMDDAMSVFQWENDDEVWRYDLDRPRTPAIEDFLYPTAHLCALASVARIVFAMESPMRCSTRSAVK